ncbi:MAG: TMEM165/GDT1 family protein [Nocardioidaceae bacterium]|nr:TMEM165/GDT1 family protein [Nocardioidaceae bacterium]MCL2614507.1 TMEM165/GDT1 family protein [Nocardioidaceae bacterium]
MIDFGVIAIVFGLIFVGELPDKTAIASLVLGARFPWRWVFAGVASAFLVHVVIAVTAGSLIRLLPHEVVEIVVAVLFLLGAVLIWREGSESEEDREREESEDEAEAAEVPATAGFAKVASLAFGTIFVAEWGDLTQILTANLAAKYHDPIDVGIGAVLALWAVGLLAMLGGSTLLKVLPMKWICRVAAVIMLCLAVWTALQVAGVV